MFTALNDNRTMAEIFFTPNKEHLEFVPKWKLFYTEFIYGEILYDIYSCKINTNEYFLISATDKVDFYSILQTQNLSYIKKLKKFIEKTFSISKLKGIIATYSEYDYDTNFYFFDSDINEEQNVLIVKNDRTEILFFRNEKISSIYFFKLYDLYQNQNIQNEYVIFLSKGINNFNHNHIKSYKCLTSTEILTLDYIDENSSFFTFFEMFSNDSEIHITPKYKQSNENKK